MSVKKINLPSVGQVSIYKRKGTRNLRLSVTGNGTIRLTVPWWASEKAVFSFIEGKKDWILKNQETAPGKIADGQRIGKSNFITFIETENSKISSRIHGNEIKVCYPNNYSWGDTPVQEAAKKVCLKALKKQSLSLLPSKLEFLAQKYGFSYNNVNVRMLKSRWGSCSSKKNIVLSTYLIQLPWEIIDYVLIHELAHTKEMNHSPSFWKQIENILPKYKLIKIDLKKYRSAILSNP